MKILQTLILLTLPVLLCGFTSKQQKNLNLLFESQIGPDNSKTLVQVFELKTAEFQKTLSVKLKKEGIIVYNDTLIIEMDEEPFINLSEINGDGMKDLNIEFLRPGRGGNNVCMVYLYDHTNLKLIKISNSLYFPNLNFDEDLKLVSSFRFYGGSAVQMDYLEIVSDTLSPKHRIIKEEQIIYVEKFTDGKWIQRDELRLKIDDLIIPEIIALEPEIKVKNAS